MLREKLSHVQDATMGDDYVAWRDIIARTICPIDLAGAVGDFHVETRLLEIGDVRVWPTTVRPVARKWASARPPEPATCGVPLSAWSVVGAGRDGDAAPYGRYERYVVDTSPPWDHVPWRLRGIGLEVPAKLLPASVEAAGTGRPGSRVVDGGGAGRPPARVLPGREGIGAVLAQFLTSLTRQAGSLRSCDAVHLEVVLTDLLVATLAHGLDAGDRPLAEPRTRSLTRSLTRRARAFVEQRLGDPELTPGAVAAAHHISVSYLHRLFRADGTTVAAWIRHRRLEAARRDLADPAQRAVPVHGIAARWGFTHHASFTRAFHAAYGLSPREYRQTAGGDEGRVGSRDERRDEVRGGAPHAGTVGDGPG